QQPAICQAWDAEFMPQPSIAGAALSVRIFGEWPVPSTPSLPSFSVVGNDVIVRLVGPTSGPAAIGNFSEAISIGTLSEGTYNIVIEVTLDLGMPNEENLTCDAIPAEIVAASVVPTTSRIGLATLGTLLALYAMRRLS
ncbi:MAG: hypothetical protein AAF690_24455, partial [Acidobacteriota bacterium]